MVYGFTCFSVAVIVTMTEKTSWGRKVYLAYNLVCHGGKPEQKLKAGTEAVTIQESCSVNFLIHHGTTFPEVALSTVTWALTVLHQRESPKLCSWVSLMEAVPQLKFLCPGSLL